jgi:Ni,Fe-hydrogenase I cytochrome b subunit
VAFRLILAIPHVLWLALLTIVVVIATIGNWFATLWAGRSPDSLHNFLAGYLRYMTHVSAYVFLIADPYPRFFLINPNEGYPIDLEIDPPETQKRWTVAFRIILAIPAMIVAQVLRNLSGILAIFSWFVALYQGSVPAGIRNFAALALRYETQTYAYVTLLTPRYPSFDVGLG